MVEYGFTEGKDFVTKMLQSIGGRPSHDAIMTMDMAKEIAMLQRSDKGKQAREYFIACEKQLKKPMTMAEIVAANANRLVEIEHQNNALAAEQIKQAEEIKQIKAQVTTTDTNYYSIAGYASYIGKHVGNDAAKKLGKSASALSRQQKYPIYQAHSSVWGRVNTYHRDILKIVFR